MKIVVIGLGAHCALGENIETLWHAIEQGHSGIAPIHRFNAWILSIREYGYQQHYVFDFQTINCG